MINLPDSNIEEPDLKATETTDYNYSDVLIKSIGNVFRYLSKHTQYLNNLNVFPVPDGDTGLNICLTIQGAIAAMRADEYKNISQGEYFYKFTNFMVLNSRGCSGVILSLYCKGIADTLNNNDFSSNNILKAFKNGYNSALSGISNPVEGTMLTVMREFYLKYEEIMATEDDVFIIIKNTIPHLKNILQKTPDMLPVLKKAGVVDSGAAGFIVLIEGISKEFNNKPRIINFLKISAVLSINSLIRKTIKGKSLHSKKKSNIKHLLTWISFNNIPNFSLKAIIDSSVKIIINIEKKFSKDHILTSSRDLDDTWKPLIKYRYCTEFVIKTDKTVTDDDLRKLLSNYGDSIIILKAEDTLKIHIHTNKPESVINLAASYGRMLTTKVDDMKKQHKNLISEDIIIYEKDNAIFCIVNGDGFGKVLKNLGASNVYVYGDKKPSVKNILNEIQSLKSKNVVIAADDKDILMSIKYAASLSKSNIEIIESRSVISLISMMMNYSSNFDINSTAHEMRKNLTNIKYFKVAKAVRQAETEDNTVVKKGDFIAFYENSIIKSDSHLDKLIIDVFTIIRKTETLITFYKGKPVKKELHVIDKLKEMFKNIEYEEYYGGQTNYYYYITLE